MEKNLLYIMVVDGLNFKKYYFDIVTVMTSDNHFITFNNASKISDTIIKSECIYILFNKTKHTFYNVCFISKNNNYLIDQFN